MHFGVYEFIEEISNRITSIFASDFIFRIIVVTIIIHKYTYNSKKNCN